MRSTTLIFFLRRSALVEFSVVRVAPDCRQLGRFRVRGRPGRNRVRFRGRVGRSRALPPGTYRITGRTLPAGRAVSEATIVIVAHPDREAAKAARTSDACSLAGSRVSDSGGSPSATAKASNGAKPAGAMTARRSPRTHGVRGARFTLPLDDPHPITLALLVLVLLGASLVALSALPVRATARRSALNAFAQNRLVVAALGIELVGVAALFYAFF